MPAGEHCHLSELIIQVSPQLHTLCWYEDWLCSNARQILQFNLLLIPLHSKLGDTSYTRLGCRLKNEVRRSKTISWHIMFLSAYVASFDEILHDECVLVFSFCFLRKLQRMIPSGREAQDEKVLRWILDSYKEYKYHFATYQMVFLNSDGIHYHSFDCFLHYYTTASTVIWPFSTEEAPSISRIEALCEIKREGRSWRLRNFRDYMTHLQN